MQLHKRTGGGHRVAEDGIEVEAVTLDSLGIEDVGMLWLDVQGHEGHALAGATELPAAVVFEYHPSALEQHGGLGLLKQAIGAMDLIDLRQGEPVTLDELDRRVGDGFTDVLATRPPRETR